MIYLDLNFDGASYLQSQARFHRIGQTAERCVVLHLLGESTIDFYIKKSLVDKIKTASQLLDKEKHVMFQTISSERFQMTKNTFLDILGSKT
jgi:DNA topoisomerase IB